MENRVTLSPKEAAHRLGISKSFLYLEMNRGNLASLSFGKRRLIHVDDLAAYVAAQRVPVKQVDPARAKKIKEAASA